eukprot:g28478.t1
MERYWVPHPEHVFAPCQLQNLGDTEVTFKDDIGEVLKVPAAKLPELPKVFDAQLLGVDDICTLEETLFFPKDSKCRSEVPEYLWILAKPLVDAILSHEPITEPGHQMGFLLPLSVLPLARGRGPFAEPRRIALARDLRHLQVFATEMLVAPQSFPELREVTLRRLDIPQDSTLAHMTDALLQLRSVEVLRLSHLRLTSRGASLLLQAVAELAPRLTSLGAQRCANSKPRQSLNGLPLARLVQIKDHPEGGSPLDLTDSIEWNDFTLGVMDGGPQRAARLSLWQVANFSGAGGVPSELKLQGQSLTDVGLRGLCAMLRHFAGQGALRSSGAVNLTKIDLSGNLQITDATVADLCHTLKTPHMGSALRGGLRELNLRKTRSAYELLNFMQHVREASREPGSAGHTLRMVNGVDLEALQAATRGDPRGRVAAPPMLLRNLVEASKATCMTECDVHFFAGVMHHFQSIPYCHVHIVIPTSLLKEDGGASTLDVWGRPAHQAGLPCSSLALVWGRSVGMRWESGSAQRNLYWELILGFPAKHHPFPPPVPGGRLQAVAAQLQAQVDATCRLFEACPALAELRISMIPAERAAKKRKAKVGSPGPAPKALYVNNINRQRLHCCFRTLYGKDDAELNHEDIMSDQTTVSLSSDVDVSNFFSVATSVDLQHLDLGPSHITKLPELSEMPALTHVNLNYNHLGDVGVELLFRALVDAGSSIEHLSVSSNDIGDEGAAVIGASLGSLPRLTSLELCDNFIQATERRGGGPSVHAPCADHVTHWFRGWVER